MAGAEKTIGDLIAEDDPWNPKNRPGPVAAGPPSSPVWDPPSSADRAAYAQQLSAGRVGDAFRDLRVQDERGDPGFLPDRGIWSSIGVANVPRSDKYQVPLDPILANHQFDFSGVRGEQVGDWLNPLSVALGIRDIKNTYLADAWAAQLDKMREMNEAVRRRQSEAGKK